MSKKWPLRTAAGTLLFILSFSAVPSGTIQAANQAGDGGSGIKHGTVRISDPVNISFSGVYEGEPFKYDTKEELKRRLMLVLGFVPGDVSTMASLVDYVISSQPKKGVTIKPLWSVTISQRSAYIYDDRQGKWLGPVTFQRRQVWAQTQTFVSEQNGTPRTITSPWMMVQERRGCHFYNDAAITQAMEVAMAAGAFKPNWPYKGRHYQALPNEDYGTGCKAYWMFGDY